MLRTKLKAMISEYGKVLTKQILIQDIRELEQKLARSSNIYDAIDIEHNILDKKSMLKWLTEES